MCIEHHPVKTGEEVRPNAQIEPIVNGDVRPVACTITGNAPYHIVSLLVTTRDGNRARQYMSAGAHAGTISEG
jgi:hypothetical protein